MITINILSQETKKELKLRRIHTAIKNSGFVFVLVIIVISMMMLIARIIMQETFNGIVAQTTLITRNSQSYNSKVREINTKINSVEQIQKGHTTPSAILTLLSGFTDDNIVYSSINISTTNNTINTRGFAGTRESLLGLKDKMESSGIFTNIEFPLANILEKTNITFTINAKINPDRIK